MTGIDSLRELLDRALIAWAASHRNSREDLEFASALAPVLKRARSAATLDEMRSHVDTAMHLKIDSGPLDAACVPSLATVADAFQRLAARSHRR